tara:strand:+ start:1948 stop:2715 length:768 start_codon:yes stop_codon:yes gene_type:complete
MRLTLRVSVWGNGIVGGTYADYLEGNGFDVRRIDPGLGLLPTDDDYLYPSIICVSAPTLSDGTVDCSAISEIAGKIFAANEETPILVKSTIPPDIAYDFSLIWESFTYSPEFLTASNAYSDIRSQKNVVLGGRNTDHWDKFFTAFNKNIIVTDARTASFMKYSINTFLATKVAFMNELENQYGGDWNSLKLLLELDPRLSASHLDVPGPDGSVGFGGGCFPKDVKAFISFAKIRSYNTQLTILEQAYKSNLKRRL